MGGLSIPGAPARAVRNVALRGVTRTRLRNDEYEWLFREEIDHGLELVDQINAYRHDYNHVRPHEAISWNRPADVHAGLANPTIPNFETAETLPTT
ncbi:MAG: integrase core domain-containing protein [Rhodoglobus sp.]